MEEEQVILVDDYDHQIGLMNKQEAHIGGHLHRAFSVFVFNSAGELLLQQRSFCKYHSPGLWTNTCCSHQRSGELTIDAAHRRLKEEMGFDISLNEVFSFIYKSEMNNGLIEHEYDYVLFGRYSGKPIINLKEVNDYQFIDLDTLSTLMSAHPARYSEWLKIAFDKVVNYIEQV